jgi:acyl-coenzyme A synthetase/AMP-(fatty) acid ligase
VATGEGVSSADLVAWVDARVGKTQPLSRAESIKEPPRNAIRKMLRRELRDRLMASPAAWCKALAESGLR